tara:strand:- start:142 stop:303 length:162 start_codon:yes stop_codon:yes gene_type:complete
VDLEHPVEVLSLQMHKLRVQLEHKELFVVAAVVVSTQVGLLVDQVSVEMVVET